MGIRVFRCSLWHFPNHPPASNSRSGAEPTRANPARSRTAARCSPEGLRILPDAKIGNRCRCYSADKSFNLFGKKKLTRKLSVWIM